MNPQFSLRWGDILDLEDDKLKINNQRTIYKGIGVVCGSMSVLNSISRLREEFQTLKQWLFSDSNPAETTKLSVIAVHICHQEFK